MSAAVSRKRQPTTYQILIEGEPDLRLLTQGLHLAGTVEAYTPDQARRRAVRDLAPVAEVAAEKGGTVVLYAVPAKNMTSRPLKVRPVAIGGDTNDR